MMCTYVVAICRGTDNFHCNSSRMCISESSHCNGVNDCEDGSDELNCADNNISVGLAVAVVIIVSLLPCCCIVITMVVTLLAIVCVCACNKKCPLYEATHRRRCQPQVGMIVANVTPTDQVNNLQRSSNESIGNYQ